MFQDANDQGKQLIRTFSPKAEPVWYKPLAQQTNISNTLIFLIVHMALRVYSGILTSQDSLAEIFSLLKKKVEDTVSDGISRADQNLPPAGPDTMQIFPDTDTVLPPPSLSTPDTKPNKSKKVTPKSIEKVYVNQIILNDKMNNVRDIFVYDVPAG
ncbi:hypothetical protein RclHR1_01000030 [Rhizophagus clarus]|uniref:Uncharacterized protein n=1 Tax=Rhizophagus clarus TaxID=94130 RepID=A0A2Z6QEJ5_9GLOM|nr:hypothetical protein RclHR1_01000030 [Rhizophagus clarus]GES94072.1 hypothetical protein RCL_jg27525.t1 [Rhizophagus clarus]